MSTNQRSRADSKAWILERRKARRFALFLVFAQLHSTEPLEEVQPNLSSMSNALLQFPSFAFELSLTVETQRSALEMDLNSVLENWRLERVGFVERALLLLGAAEIAFFPDIPPRVTINEYIELSKIYCDANAPAFINGVLDKIAKLRNKTDF